MGGANSEVKDDTTTVLLNRLILQVRLSVKHQKIMDYAVKQVLVLKKVLIQNRVRAAGERAAN